MFLTQNTIAIVTMDTLAIIVNLVLVIQLHASMVVKKFKVDQHVVAVVPMVILDLAVKLLHARVTHVLMVVHVQSMVLPTNVRVLMDTLVPTAILHHVIQLHV